jgi:hypothetical protein
MAGTSGNALSVFLMGEDIQSMAQEHGVGHASLVPSKHHPGACLNPSLTSNHLHRTHNTSGTCFLGTVAGYVPTLDQKLDVAVVQVGSHKPVVV